MRRFAELLSAVLLGGCECDEAKVADAGATDCGSLEFPLLDAGIDAQSVSSDAGLPWCPDFFPEGHVTVLAPLDRTDTEYTVAVLSVVDEDPIEITLQNPADSSDIVIRYPRPEVGSVALPEVGSRVKILGGDCWLDGYVRVTSEGGTLLFEGGTPSCERERAILRVQNLPQAQWCNEPVGEVLPPYEPEECCCITWREQVTVLRAGACEEVLPVGVAMRRQIGGRWYVVTSFGAYSRRDGPCSADASGTIAFAYVALLAD